MIAERAKDVEGNTNRGYIALIPTQENRRENE